VTTSPHGAREIGVAHTEGNKAFFSLSPNQAFSILVKEGSTNDSPEQVDAKFEQMLALHETRAFVVVIWGGLDFCTGYREHVRKADFLVFCSDESVLQRLGVPILDAGWDESDEPIGSLTDLLFGERAGSAPRQKSGWRGLLTSATAVAAIDLVVSAARRNERRVKSPWETEIRDGQVVLFNMQTGEHKTAGDDAIGRLEDAHVTGENEVTITYDNFGPIEVRFDIESGERLS